MPASGRGRGRAAYTFSIEALGFGKGAALPDAICKPPPSFPSTDNKPVPLKTEDEDYMLILKQDFRGTMKRMPYFLTVEEHQVNTPKGQNAILRDLDRLKKWAHGNLMTNEMLHLGLGNPAFPLQKY